MINSVFVFDAMFSGMYILKLMQFLGSWIAAYIARVIFVQNYVRQTQIRNLQPPQLIDMLTMFAVIYLIITLLLGTLCALGTWTEKINHDVLTAFAVDAVTCYLVTIIISRIFAVLYGNRVVFQYVVEGDHAARALEESIVTTSMIVNAIPFFLVM